MSSHTNTQESGFEQLIERALVGSTVEERRNRGIALTAEYADRQPPSIDGADLFFGECGDDGRPRGIRMSGVMDKGMMKNPD